MPRDWSVTHTRETQLLPRTYCDTRGPGAGAGGLQDHWGPVLHIPDISAIEITGSFKAFGRRNEAVNRGVLGL